jgi:serine/threonine protein kinase/uncharacterized protein YjdB
VLPGFDSLPPADSASVIADIVERLRRATLGEFEVGEELGRGGMAAVFLAHDISLDRKVAIKVMAPGLLLGEGNVERFRHEAITIAQLQHPNIVSVYSVRQAEGLHFFVMRYVEGRSLEQVIERAGKLPLPIVRSVLHQVGAALTHAHRARVIHRDIKPANILIDTDGNAVVTDFGIAKAAESPTRTITGALVGTPAYMSPEQCSGAEVSGASDQYALGAVAYEMLTGVPPFTGSTLTVMQAHVEHVPAPVEEHCPDAPPEFAAAILRMLAKDPATRWATIPDALAALRAAPLPEEDPLRSELRGVVLGARGLTSASPTPTSPIPRTHPSAVKTAADSRAVGGISILPPPAGLEVGDSFVLVAMVRGRHGTRLPPSSVIWSSEPPGVLRFDPGGGVAIAAAPGFTVLTATCRDKQAQLRVEIAPPAADEIVIGSLDHAVAVGDEVRLDAVARDKRGQPVLRAVSWRSADASVATVTSEGALVARAEGFTRVIATLDDAQASITLPVLPARVAALQVAAPETAVAGGSTFAVTATAVDRWGRPLGGRQVLWSSSNVRVAVVTVGGTVHALRPGSVVLTASSEGVSESVRVSVEGRPSAAAPAEPAEPQLAAPPTPIVRHRRPKRRRRGRRIAAFLALAAIGGGAWWLTRHEPPTVTAEVPEEASAAEAEVAIDSGGKAAVVITRRPGRALRPAGATRLAAEVRDRDGRADPSGTVTWSSADPTIVRVNPSTGWVRAVRPGRASVVASSGEGRDSVTITVRAADPEAPAVSSVSIAPREPLLVGDTATLEAIVLDAIGARSADAEVAWQSSNLAILEINSNTGQIRARQTGTALVFARSGGESAIAEITVGLPAVATVRVRGVEQLVVGETLSLWAEVTDSGGTALAGRPVTWSSSDPAVAGVWPASGLVVANAPGTADIVATAEGRSGGARVTVVRPREAAAASAAADRQAIEDVILAGVQACYDAVRAGDADRVAALYAAETDADRDKLRKLNRILQTQEWSAVVGAKVNGERRMGDEAATMDFSFQLSWKDAFGGRLSSQLTLRADFAGSGDRWRMASCRIVGSPKL